MASDAAGSTVTKTPDVPVVKVDYTQYNQFGFQFTDDDYEIYKPSNAKHLEQIALEKGIIGKDIDGIIKRKPIDEMETYDATAYSQNYTLIVPFVFVPYTESGIPDSTPTNAEMFGRRRRAKTIENWVPGSQKDNVTLKKDSRYVHAANLICYVSRAFDIPKTQSDLYSNVEKAVYLVASFSDLIDKKVFVSEAELYNFLKSPFIVPDLVAFFKHKDTRRDEIMIGNYGYDFSNVVTYIQNFVSTYSLTPYEIKEVVSFIAWNYNQDKFFNGFCHTPNSIQLENTKVGYDANLGIKHISYILGMGKVAQTSSLKQVSIPGAPHAHLSHGLISLLTSMGMYFNQQVTNAYSNSKDEKAQLKHYRMNFFLGVKLLESLNLPILNLISTQLRTSFTASTKTAKTINDYLSSVVPALNPLIACLKMVYPIIMDSMLRENFDIFSNCFTIEHYWIWVNCIMGNCTFSKKTWVPLVNETTALRIFGILSSDVYFERITRKQFKQYLEGIDINDEKRTLFGKYDWLNFRMDVESKIQNNRGEAEPKKTYQHIQMSQKTFKALIELCKMEFDNKLQTVKTNEDLMLKCQEFAEKYAGQYLLKNHVTEIFLNEYIKAQKIVHSYVKDMSFSEKGTAINTRYLLLSAVHKLSPIYYSNEQLLLRQVTPMQRKVNFDMKQKTLLFKRQVQDKDVEDRKNKYKKGDEHKLSCNNFKIKNNRLKLGNQQ